MIGQTLPEALSDAMPEVPAAAEPKPDLDATKPNEFGGRDGPDPTRYGDWEKNGRCIDF